MSERNGDKSRFGRKRREKRLRRKRNREWREKLGLSAEKAGTPAPAK